MNRIEAQRKFNELDILMRTLNEETYAISGIEGLIRTKNGFIGDVSGRRYRKDGTPEWADPDAKD